MTSVRPGWSMAWLHSDSSRGTCALVDTDLRLEPDPVAIDQGNRGGRHVAQRHRKADDVVEGLLGAAVENGIGVQRRLALAASLSRGLGAGARDGHGASRSAPGRAGVK